MPMPDDTIKASSLLTDEAHLALDGYHLTVIPTDSYGTLGKVTLNGGPEEFARVTFELDPDCPKRDEALVTAMLGFLNSGGDPKRLGEIAGQITTLPHIQPNPYTVLGVYGHVDWVSFYQHHDGRIFEVHHGTMAEEISRERLEQVLEADDLSAGA